MLRHIKRRISSNIKTYIYSMIYIMIITFTIFLMLSFRDISTRKIQKSVKFYEKSSIINYGVKSSLYPEGYMPSSEDIIKLKEDFEYITEYAALDITASGKQQVDFVAVSSDFIYTGVPFFNLELRANVVDRVELLFGRVWNNDTANKIIVDEKTANLIFGYSNVVGEKLESNNEIYEIIGVVSETYERNKYIKRYIEAGNTFEEHLIPTIAYMEYNFAKTQNMKIYNNSIVIRDDSVKTGILPQEIAKSLGIKDYLTSGIITDRNQIINQKIMDNKFFYQLILSITTILGILWLTNLINILMFNYRGDLKKIGIYKTLGITNKQMILISMTEGGVLSLISTITSIILGYIVLFTYSLFTNSFKYINFIYLTKVSLKIISYLTVITVIMNFVITLVGYNKKPVI